MELEFFISVANHKEQSKWKNQKVTWEEFVEKFKEPIRTKETTSDYHRMGKATQDKIKDVGGYVGGYLVDGKRKINCVRERQLICLDVDESLTGIPNINYMGLLHTTHKHTKSEPRYRIIIPCKDKLSIDAYEYISRHLAKEIGIFDEADRTTYQPNRLMYWASCPIDGEYIFKEFTGELFDAQKVLDANPKWKDECFSDIPKNELEKIRKQIIKKQQDPRTKKGVIKAFCDEYSIQSCIEKFLPHLYSATDIPNRYTWIEGSTTGGCLLFDDLFSYSYHSTDPTCMILCNAYDLVRYQLHKGDENKALAFCASQEGVGNRIAMEDFGEAYQEWQGDLEYSKNGKLKDTIENFKLIISNELNVTYDEFSQQLLIDNRPYKNQDDNRIFALIEKKYGVYSPAKTQIALDVASQENAFHPMKEYFEGLIWDGKPRLERLLIDYFKAEDNIYTREAIKLTLVGGVKRIYEPGCELQTILVLRGEQRIGKSYLFRLLTPVCDKYFSDSLTLQDVKDTKISGEQLKGNFILEIPEMAGQTKADEESIKAFIVRRTDKFRPAFGRVLEEYPRQCILFASTNKAYLTDLTGNRRFLTVNCYDRTTNFIDKAQIWAEAKYLYNNYYIGEDNKLELSSEARKLAQDVEADNIETDDRVSFIEEFIKRKIPIDWATKSTWDRIQFLNEELSPTTGDGLIERQYISTQEIWCEMYQRPKFEMKRNTTNDIMRSLAALGYTEKIQIVDRNYGRIRAYKKPDKV